MSLKPASANTLLWFSDRKNIRQIFRISQLWNWPWLSLLSSILSSKQHHFSETFQAAAKFQRHFMEMRVLCLCVTLVNCSCLLQTDPRWVLRRRRASLCCWRRCTNVAGTLPRSSTHPSHPEPGPPPPERENNKMTLKHKEKKTETWTENVQPVKLQTE